MIFFINKKEIENFSSIIYIEGGIYDKYKRKKLKPGEIIPLTCDFMFTGIFNKQENIDILEYFLSFYLEIPFEKITGNLKLLSRKLDLKNKKDRTKEIDILLSYNKRKINIELSSSYIPTGVKERNIVYICSVHSRQLKYGDNKYQNIHETIQINFVNSEFNKYDISEQYYLTNNYGDILSKKLRIDVIDLAKAKKMCYPISNKLARWCRVLTSTSEKELRENLGDDLMKKESKEKLITEINDLSSDDECVVLYTKLSKSELERNTILQELSDWKKEAKDLKKEANDLKKETSNLKKEAKENFRIGIEKGFEQRNIEIAKNLLNQGVDLKIINSSTGLSLEEIEKLRGIK